ncbi:hypothetical protein [Uliginosibacterium sp. TH139]|uniref:hypothetical protein n=1 Tax=Uliginosibacterium sp. TH139 TaxID=2067453 RepID=UPI000C7BD7A7|nr:hypothetical protein [Uliginosibacterium sp. TH139]PLK46978.1 hypothetical protein C0V76_19160 [Uliginosibacterium sp. TH139]
MSYAPTFGDEFSAWVDNDAYAIARKFTEPDLVLRTLNYVAVTRDFAVRQAEEALAASNLADAMVKSFVHIQSLMDLPEGTLDKAGALEIASYRRDARLALYQLSIQYDRMAGMKEVASALDEPMSFDAFRMQGLGFLAYNAILSSAIDFGRIPMADYYVYAGIEVSGDQPPKLDLLSTDSMIASGASVIATYFPPAAPFVFALFFAFSVLRAREYEQKYEHQVEQYRNALGRLMARMPKEQEVYDVYLASFKVVAQQMRDENLQLVMHLGDHLALLGQQMQWLQATLSRLEDVLLQSRMNGLIKALQMGDVMTNTQATLILLQTASTLSANMKFLRAALLEVNALHGTVAGWAMTEELSAKLQELALQLRVQREDLALAPLHSLIDQQQDFVKRQIQQLLDGATEQACPVGDSPAVLSLLHTPESHLPTITAPLADAVLGSPSSVLFAYLSSQRDQVVGWIGGYASQFSRSGRGIYGRNVDGSGILDLRSPGRENLAAINANLGHRTANNLSEAELMRKGLAKVAPNQSAALTLAAQEIGRLRIAVAQFPSTPPMAPRSQTPPEPALLQWDSFSARLSRERNLLATTGGAIRNLTESELEALKFYGSMTLAYASTFNRLGNAAFANRYLTAAQGLRRYMVGQGDRGSDESYTPLVAIDPLVVSLSIAYPIPTGDLPPGEQWRTACNRFVAHSLSLVYGYNAFIDPSKEILQSLGIDYSDIGPPYEHKYLRAEHIQQYLSLSAGWKRLGTGASAEALVHAAFSAGVGLPVLAVSIDHVALVMPGEPIMSGSWGARVPYVASFSLGNPRGSFYYGPISRAWRASRRGDVLLFVYDPD